MALPEWASTSFSSVRSFELTPACSRATATDVVDRLHLNTPAAELRGLTFEELAERIAHEENGDQQEWKDWHKDNVGEDPKARWSKAQIIQSVLGDLDLP